MLYKNVHLAVSLSTIATVPLKEILLDLSKDCIEAEPLLTTNLYVEESLPIPVYVPSNDLKSLRDESQANDNSKEVIEAPLSPASSSK